MKSDSGYNYIIVVPLHVARRNGRFRCDTSNLCKIWSQKVVVVITVKLGVVATFSLIGVGIFYKLS